MKKESEEYALLFESGNVTRVEIVVSLLRGAGLDCHVKNAGVQNLFGLGSAGGFNPLLGAVKVYVRREDLRAAQEIFSQVPPETELPVSGVAVEGTSARFPRKPIVRIGFFFLGVALLIPSLIFFWGSCRSVILGFTGGPYRMTTIDTRTVAAGLCFVFISLTLSMIGYLMIRYAVRKSG